MRDPNPCVTFLCAVAAVAAFGVVNARADGLPVLGIDVGGTGVASTSGDARYVTMPAGRNTVVATVNPRGGRVLSSTVLPGTLTIPAVAYDGSASGLSADGRRLVLIEPRVSFPRTWTTLIVVDTRLFRPGQIVKLHGDFSFDAVSPHGSLLYLIQYISPVDPTVYRVRVYDVRAGKLIARPVTDPRERGQKMHGSPQTRATSPNGRWAYTLYDGAGAMPFVHALDTSTRSARCIDLPTLAGADLSGLRLRVDRGGATLTVSNRRQPVLTVDTRTFRTTVPAQPPTGIPWLLVAFSIVGAFAAAGVLWLALRRCGGLIRPRPRTPARAS